MLALSHNGITDISALAGLDNLTYLLLDHNQISDISSLAGLSNLETLDLEGNTLNAEAYAVYIPMILAQNPGISLSYDPVPEPTSLLLMGPMAVLLISRGRMWFRMHRASFNSRG